MTSPTLLSPIKVGEHTLDHRVVLAPMTRLRNDENGVITDRVVEHYTQRTTPNGLLITDATQISAAAGGYPFGPGIYTEEQIAGWRRVTKAVHAKGGIIYCQLWHVGRAISSSAIPNNEPPVSASAIAIKGNSLFGTPHEVPRALTVEEIQGVIHDFAVAAENAIKAGFDGVEIHGANGYLVDSFINTSSNTRTDEYGGSIENRARFALEVLDAVVKAVGVTKSSIRFSPWSAFQDMEDETPVETWSYLTQQIQTNYPDLAYLHFIESREGGHSDEELQHHESLEPFRAIWKGPFITSGGFTDPKKAIERCEDSPNNLIAFGRIFIANPDLVERIRHGWPLNKYHRPTFYSHDVEGYTDYPFYQSSDDKGDDQIEQVIKTTDQVAVAEPAINTASGTSSDSETTKQADINNKDTKNRETKANKRKSKLLGGNKAKCIIQ